MWRFLRRLAIWLVRGVALVLGLVVLALVLVTQVPVLRDRLALWGEALLLQYGDVRLSAQQVVRLDPWGAELRGAHVEIPEIGLSADVERARVSFRPWALLNRDVRFASARAEGVRAKFGPPVTKPMTPAEAAAEAAEDDDDEWGTTLERVALTDGEVVSDHYAPDTMVRIASLAGAVSYWTGPDVWIRHAALEVSRRGQPLLTQGRLKGSYRAASGGTVNLQGKLAGAPLGVSARLPSWDGQTDPLPLEALELSLGGVDRHWLRQLGLEKAVPLRARVDLGLAVRREGDKLHGALKAFGGGASARLNGTWRTGRIDATLHASAASLHRLVADLPEQSLRGTVRAAYRYGKRSQQLSAQWDHWRVDELELPSGRLEARWRGDNVVVDQLALSDLHGSVTGSGRYDSRTGEAHAKLVVRALSLAGFSRLLGKPIGGAATGNATFVRDQRGDMRLDSRFFLGAPKFGETLKARSLATELTVSGSVAAPKAVVRLVARHLRVATTVIPKASAKIALEHRNFSAYFKSGNNGTDLHGLISGLLDFSQESPGVSLRAELNGRVVGRPIFLVVPQLRYAAGALTIRDVVMRSGAARLDATCELGANGNVDLTLRAKELPLEFFGAIAGMPNLRGKFSTTAHLTGSQEEPVLSLDATLLEGTIGETPVLDTVLTLWLDANQRRAAAQVSSYGASGHSLNGAFELTWPDTPKALLEALPLAHGRAYLTARTLVDDLPIREGFGAVGLGGAWLEASANLEGSLEKPSGLVTLLLREAADGPSQIEAKAIITDQSAAIDFSATDNRRAAPLLTGRADVALPDAGGSQLWSSVMSVGPDLHAELEWHIDALDQLRGVPAQLIQRVNLNLPLRSTGSLKLTREQGHFAGSLQATGDLRSNVLDADCSAGTNVTLMLQADVNDERLNGAIVAETSSGGNAYANFTFPTPWLWNWPEQDDHKEASLDAQAAGVPLYALPGLCHLDTGQAGISLASRLVPGQPLSASLEAHIDGISVSGGKPVAVELKSTIDPKNLHVLANIQSEGKKGGTFEATLPLRYDGYRPGVVLTEPISAKFRAAQLSFAPMMQFTESVGRASGMLSADIQVEGTLRKPLPKGYLVFDELSFTLASLAQPVRGLVGRLEFSGDTVTLHDVSARDRSGRLYLGGKAKLSPDGSADAKLNLRTENLPVRRSGQLVGKVSMGADLIAHLDQHAKLVVEAAVRYATLQFSGDTGKAVQPLDAHPDVRFADEPADDEDALVVHNPNGFELLSFEVKSQKDIELKHRDFTLQLGVDLALKEVAGKRKLVGEASIKRGNLKLLGKSFTIQRGSVRFTEDSSEPELDLTASFDPPGGGTRLTVLVSGRASNPALNFSGAADTPEQAFAILSGLGTAQAAASAQADVNAFGLSLTAGLLSMNAREQLGGWVPTVSVGSNSRGQASQARAGFDASSMIPRFMRRFARGAYVEGIVSQTQEGTGGSVGVGMKFELALPRSTVTTFTYGPGTVWAIDVAWIP